MIPLEFFWTLGDIIAAIVCGLLIVGLIIFWLYVKLIEIYFRIFKNKAYTKVYTDYPDMLLDRKWGVKYKKHFWNKWKEYIGENCKFATDYTRYEAGLVSQKIKNGEIKI